MEFVNLADRTEAIPLIAEWYFDEWGPAIKDMTLDKTLELVRSRCNRGIPLTVLAMEGEEPVGVAQLKFHEMDIYPEKKHWLGGVFVPPNARGKGIGGALVGEILVLAKTLKVENLYLQTERTDGGLYAKLGWKPMERVIYNGFDVLVMDKNLRIYK